MSAVLTGTVTISPETRRPNWVSEMQSHFQQTGAVRAEDIIRVLGNPLESVEVAVTKQSTFGRFERK
jgi:hypothetical protein